MYDIPEAITVDPSGIPSGALGSASRVSRIKTPSLMTN